MTGRQVPDPSKSSIFPNCHRWRANREIPLLHRGRLCPPGMPLGHNLDLPCVLDGPINRESFKAYIEQFLVPTLRPGDIVIIDNLGSHKGKAVRRVIRAAGAKLFFLPPYSPDLNPIEQVFAKLKDPASKGCRANRRRHLEAHRHLAHPLYPQRVRQLLRQCRIRFNMNRSCSSHPKAI